MTTTPRPVVLDTNVVLDWLAFDDPNTRALGRAIEEGHLHWLRSQAMVDELVRVLQYPALQARQLDATALLARAAAHGAMVPPGPPAPAALQCADPDDQGFIDLALAYPGCLLLSRDKAVLQLSKAAQTHGLTVWTPAQWLAQHAMPTP